MSDTAIKLTPFVRAEYERDVQAPKELGDVAKALPLAERLWNSPLVRKLFILVLLAIIWEAYARWSANRFALQRA